MLKTFQARKFEVRVSFGTRLTFELKGHKLSLTYKNLRNIGHERTKMAA